MRPLSLTDPAKPLAVVTGASSGIGYELAKQFARRGFDLIVAAEDPGVGEVARECSALGAQVQALEVDLSTPEGMQHLHQLMEAIGPVDALAISAGLGFAGDADDHPDVSDELHVVRLNVVSTLYLTKRVAAKMVERGRGQILLGASMASLLPASLEGVCGASREFLLSFAESLRAELEGTGVTVTTILPGPTHSGGEDPRAPAVAATIGDLQRRRPSTAEVARRAVDALLAGRANVVTGDLSTKVQRSAGRFLAEAQHAHAQRAGWADVGARPRGA